MVKRALISVISILTLTTIITLSSAKTADLITGQLQPKSSQIPSDKIILAINQEIPGYFTLNGETFGYQYELINEFAETIGRDIEIMSQSSASGYETLLADGTINMAATLSKHITDTSNIAIPVYKTSYVLLATKKNSRKFFGQDNVYDIFNGKKLLISQGFSASETYHDMLDSLNNTEIYLSARNSFDLIEALSHGKYDYLICEESEAKLGCALVKNIAQVIEFEEEIPVYVLFNSEDAELANDFGEWLSEFSMSERQIALSEKYFKKGISNHIILGGITGRQAGGISKYDDLLKEICSEENMDWRLVSAIAYTESKFNPYVVSPRGAKGIMQVMPAVAKQFGYSSESLMNPETNILVAVKIIRQIERSLKFSAGTDFANKTSIILACYNGGIGHVIDARKLALKHGGDPDLWTDVRKYLELKSLEEYAQDDVVVCGKFNGSKETAKFVTSVLSRYDKYCMLQSR